MRFDPLVPYNGLPLLPPTKQELETKAILKEVIDASRSLAELKVPHNNFLIKHYLFSPSDYKRLKILQK